MTALRTVVGYDGSAESRAALLWALDDARRTGAAVELVHGYALPALMAMAPMVPTVSGWPDEEALRAMLDEAVAATRDSHPQVAVTSTLLRGPAAAMLIDRAAHATLLVVGGRGHSAAAEIVLGSVSGAVAMHAPCPVVVVRTRAGTDDHRPVLVGLDDSAGAELAAGFAFEQAAARGVALRAVRAWLPPPNLPLAPTLPDEIARAEQRALVEQLARWRDKFPGVPVTTDAVAGHPARVLTDAGRTAQLLVVGSRGRGGFRSLLLGSVSRHLLHHATCTIAVVRDAGPAVAARTDPHRTEGDKS